MKKRSPIGVLLLSIVTGGIFGLIWLISTKEEMVARGADIPTALLLFIPFVNLYWLWRWSKGVEHVTKGASSAAGIFFLQLLCGLGMVMAQSSFNSVP